MEPVLSWLRQLRLWLEYPLIRLGEAQITLWSVAYLLVLLVLLFWVSRRLQRWLTGGPVLRSELDESARHAVGAIARYLMLAIGLLVIVQTAGIDLTTLNVLAGAIGIGVGFGLQNVVSNFIPA